MKVEICDLWKGGRTVYYWTLYDGPDGIDKVSGYATTLEETVCKILDWRQRIANDYCGSIEEVGGGAPIGLEHGDPGRGDDGNPEQGPEH